MNRARLLRAAEKMKDLHVSQMLVTAPASICYFTGAWIEPGERMLALVVRDDGSAVLIANRLFAVTGVEPLAEFDDIDDPIATLSGFISPGKLGVDKTWPSGFLLRLMDARRDVEPILVSAVVDDCRMVKDREELELMREASRLNDLAVNFRIGRVTRAITDRAGRRI